MNTTTTRRLGAAVAAALLLATAACGSAETQKATQASTVSIKDPWVKAQGSGMTAAFGTLRNASGQKATIVSATSKATPSMELHEMATDENGKMVMRPKKDGFTIPAEGTHRLDPGGDHLMFMSLPKPIEPGDEVTITLTFADSSKMTFRAPARSFSGAEEDYDPDAGHGSMKHDSMDMGGSGHDD